MKAYALGVVGTGLIGGSMAIDLRRRGFAGSVLGVEADPVAAAAAEKLGIVDRVVPLEECVRESDIILVAVPVSAAIVVIGSVLDLFEKEGYADKIVMDVCSTKEKLAQAVLYHPCRKQLVLTHPMAGTEYSGPWAAIPNLFDGRACILADTEESNPRAVAVAQSLYETLNMHPTYMRSSSHDVHTAYVSHLSHVLSFALALTVLDKEKDEKHIFDLASGGFSSTVRLAKSGANMWVPILLQNRDNVIQVLDTYRDKLKAFRQALEEYDEPKVRELIEEANRIKKIIR